MIIETDDREFEIESKYLKKIKEAVRDKNKPLPPREKIDEWLKKIIDEDRQ